MIKVLEVFDSLEISGGVQGVVMNIYRKMDRERVSVDFAVYDAPARNSYQGEIEAKGGRVFLVKNLSEAGVLGFYAQFKRFFEDNHYDAVHAHNIHHNGLILLAAKNAGVPIRISHSHQAFDERNESFARKTFAALLKQINNRVATRKVACSDLAAEFLYGKNTPYEFLPNAVDVTRFDIAESKEELRRSFGILDDDQSVLLHIGRLSPQKNQFFLIEIMEQLRQNNCVLLIAGEGPLKNEFLNKVEKANLSDKIRYIGLRKDVPQLLKMADVMLLPSIYEGLPVVAIEAQAAGCYSILSDVITRQADLDVGLVKYLGINSPDCWAEEIGNINRAVETVNIESIHNKMKTMKFDTQTNLEAWYELYGAV